MQPQALDTEKSEAGEPLHSTLALGTMRQVDIEPVIRNTARVLLLDELDRVLLFRGQDPANVEFRSVLVDLGLIPGLEWLLSKMSGRTELRSTLKVEGKPIRLGPDPELALFRIAQESLRNVERHSNASQVTVAFTYGKDEVRLEVTDDGKGFQHQRPLASEGGLGLVRMQERARLIGATLHISREPGSTRVSLEMATKPHAAEDFGDLASGPAIALPFVQAQR